MFIIVVDSRDLKRAARALRKHANGRELSKELMRGIREEVRPALKAVRSAYGGGRKLRPALRRATRMTVAAGKGVSIRVDGFRMPSGMGSLPAYREAVKGPWRHPVFGNTDVWVTQAPRPVFFRTVEPFAPKVERRIAEVAEEICQKIANG